MGRPHEALALAEEVVSLRRELAAANPAFVPDLASALTNLGVRYSKVGRPHEALAPTEEAASLRRELAAANPAFMPDLAMALNNLGIHYGGVGRRQEALAPAEEALTLYRELAAANPAFVPDLARALTNLSVRYGGVGRRREALAPAEEAVSLYRELAAANPAFVPNLAGALTNLGVRYSEVGRRQEALAPVEEAVSLYRELAAANPAFVPDLAGALNNLGIHYGGVGRPKEALAPAEEAAALYRELAAANAAFVPDLAMALNNLAIRYGEVGRPKEALAPAEEAVSRYRELAAANARFVPDLARALTNLAIRYSEVGRPKEAFAPAEEAVSLYRQLAASDTLFVPDLARALNNLDDRCRETGTPEVAAEAWRDAIAAADPQPRALLLLARARNAPLDDLGVVQWLVGAASLADDDRRLRSAIHQEARQRRAANQTSFDADWVRLTSAPRPEWLDVDADLLASAQNWITTPTYEAERDHLAEHPELLSPTTELAITEALLNVSEPDAARHVQLIAAAAADGVDAAYEPLLMTALAAEFIDADLATQRALLADRRDELLGEHVSSTVQQAATQTDAENNARRAHALLALALLGDDDAALDALADGSRWPGLLLDLAVREDPAALTPAASLALHSATQAEQTADGLFYTTVAALLASPESDQTGPLNQARSLNPDATTRWIAALAKIAQHHPPALTLIEPLTAPPPDTHTAPHEEGS